MQKNYFSAFHARMSELCLGYLAVPVIQFNGYKGGAGPGGRRQVYIFPAPKIKIEGVRTGVAPGGGVSFAFRPIIFSTL